MDTHRYTHRCAHVCVYMQVYVHVYVHIQLVDAIVLGYILAPEQSLLHPCSIFLHAFYQLLREEH